MAYWSAENATNAFLSTLKMGKSTKEPDEAEFISALAAGSNAQLMVLVASQNPLTNYTILTALSSAAYQKSSRVVCIFATVHDYETSMEGLELNSTCNIDFAVGHPQTLLLKNYRDADFVLIDCENLKSYEEVVVQIQKRSNHVAVVVGCNALSKDSTWQGCESKTTHLLPIGRGLLVTRIPPSFPKAQISIQNDEVSSKKTKSRWVVKVDECTGEEHVFRVRIPRGY